MAVAVNVTKEIEYYLEERKQVVQKLTSESWDPLCVINLKIAFRKGYEAKGFYDRKKN